MNFTVIPEAITFTHCVRGTSKLGIGLFNSPIRRSLLTEEVTTAPDISPEVKAVGGRKSRLSFYHLSGGLAGTLGKKQNVWLGGTLDFVVGNSRIESTGVFTYDQGESGFVTDGEVSVQTSFGLQLKAGLQWAPIREIRVGISVATPSDAFILIHCFATTFGQSPPDANAQAADGTKDRGVRGGWWRRARQHAFGNCLRGRVGAGFEGDLVIQWRLRTPELGIDLKTIVNGRVGSAFRLTRFMKLGVGAFTDRSPIDRIRVTRVATTDIDFYGYCTGLSLFKPRGSSRPAGRRAKAEEKRRSVSRSRSGSAMRSGAATSWVVSYALRPSIRGRGFPPAAD